MKTFEQQTAEAVRILTIAVVVLAFAVMGGIGLATWGILAARSDSTRITKQQAELAAAVKSPTHGKDIATWCNAINASRDYQRGYNKGTLQQSESEAATIEKAIANPHAHGLTTDEAAFIREYLNSVVALEQEAPQTLSLHPYTLKDLNCTKIEAGEKASTHTVK